MDRDSPGTEPLVGGCIALLFTTRWLEASVMESLQATGLSALRYAEAAELAARQRQAPVDLVLIEDTGNHFSHSLTTLRFRGTATLPVIAVGRGASQEISRALQQGAVDYAVLAETLQLLVHRVQARLLIRSRSKTGAAPQAGGCRLEDDPRSLRSGDRTIGLTPREHALARALFEHPGQPVSVASLARQVWGADVEVSKRTIEQHVSRLRSKLRAATEGEAQQLALQAIHNVGYRLTVSSRQARSTATATRGETGPEA